MKICIYGASSSELKPEFYSAAERLGVLLAENGHGMVFGGGKEGLMGAAARGVHSLGGEMIGIAPGFFDEPGILFEHCTELILTDTMRERKRLMQEKADAFLVLPGGIGTLEEFFETLTLKQLGQENRAIVLLNTCGFFDSLYALLRELADKGFMSHRCLEIFSLASTPEEALRLLTEYVPNTGDINRLSEYNK